MVIEIRIDAALASAAVAAEAVVTKEVLAEPPAAGLARLELPPESNSFKVWNISKTMKCILLVFYEQELCWGGSFKAHVNNCSANNKKK